MATSTAKNKSDASRKGDGESLADEVAMLRDELEAVAALARQVGVDGIALAKVRAKARLGEGIEKGQDAATKIAEEVASEWHAAEKRLVREATEHPWRTLGLAAVGGLALGLLLRR